MRLLFATVLLLVLVRPRWRGHSRRAGLTVTAFGVALGLMNTRSTGRSRTCPSVWP